MSLDRFKDVTIGDYKYQLERFTPAVGAWMADIVPEGAAVMGEANFSKVQGYILSSVRVYKTPPGGQENLYPIFGNGKWLQQSLDLDLYADLSLQDELKHHVLDFNLTETFMKRAARNRAIIEKAEAKKLEDQAPPSITSQNHSPQA